LGRENSKASHRLNIIRVCLEKKLLFSRLALKKKKRGRHRDDNREKMRGEKKKAAFILEFGD